MYKTWMFFTAGGIFTAFYSNAVRRKPLLRMPILHISCTAVGFTLGYLMHRYEEGSEERTDQLLERYKHAPRQWAQQLSKDE